MTNQTLARVAIEGSVSAAQCSLLRDKVEGAAFENAGLPAHNVPMPGAEFWQLQSSMFWLTYMLIDDAVYCYDAVKFKWQRMFINANQIRSMRGMVKRVA